jgi:hypothetical protein
MPLRVNEHTIYNIIHPNSLNRYQLGLNTLFIDLVECKTHTNQILRTDIKTGSTYLKFGLVKVRHCVCVCVWKVVGEWILKDPTNFKKNNGLVILTRKVRLKVEGITRQRAPHEAPTLRALLDEGPHMRLLGRGHY